MTIALVLFGGLFNLLLGVIVLMHGASRKASYYFAGICLLSFILITLDALFRVQATHIVLRAAFAVGALVPAVTMLWTVVFTKLNWSPIKQIITTAPAIIMAILSMVEGLIVKDVIELLNFGYRGEFGFMITPYMVVASSYFVVSFYFLMKSLKNLKKKVGTILIMIGIFLYASSTIFVVFILPKIYNIHSFTMLDAPSSIFFVIFASYAILQYKIIDVKVITAEILTAALWIFMFIKLLTENNLTDKIIDIVMLIIFLVLGYFLIKSVRSEVKTRERLHRLNQELKKLDDKKNEFLHIATHQLRGPITAINGYASLIKDGDYGEVSDKIDVPIDNILSASKVMSETINDYMNIARIEEDNVVQNSTEFDLCSLVNDRAGVRLVNAKDKGIKLDLVNNVEGGVCKIKADKNNMTQVLNALLENAIKYTNKGSVVVTTELTKSGKRVRVSIKDTGIGVAKKEVAKLFDKFTRADNAKETDAFGTGMGLFIAKNLVEANGGKISVDSEGLNKGTTFTIELPLVK